MVNAYPYTTNIFPIMENKNIHVEQWKVNVITYPCPNASQ